ncbi:cystathionine beta-synthase-like isoform X1 [Amphibalanus amphitrite]|uniref:cystathionine beta-synthase-like isoform X1 n=1 Tax=Amphibalanus amphitrite TaxID=1232801 RepID=UPI001C905861|nr:cystathionine beta-synthase-like isoform X1 [Amphibalanus amphitrite]XP_043191338.1 cystathionine beta-synthase-like isoform X1 [Amphibalanus amphitrite]XP_043191339.1 cystathionine beta-synthase-like isoform X1 [Amphibalanus amphitrite]XP_043191340.1 cystathionine beta-synthase-like isoform X1 [Amphibalanus amphitrite]
MAPMPPTPTVPPSEPNGLRRRSRTLSSHSLDPADFVRPDLPSKCKWKPGAPVSDSPHSKCPVRDEVKIMPNILHQIGRTPMVRLNKIPQSLGIKCEVLVKCEFFNAGGSVKDRIALRMVEDAERDGLIKAGSTLIEPTSGNTGIGLALAAAVKGYRAIIVMPEKMSNEKVAVLRALGAEIVRTPTSASWDAPESHISVAQRLQKEIPDAIILDQYRNPGNPLAHYDTTAEEILHQCDGRVDMVVLGAGTCGTVSGVGRKMRDAGVNCTVVGVDPHGSILAHEPDEVVEGQFYEVEGIGYDFYPTVLDKSVIDKWIKCGDKESLLMCRRLIREEGLLCGGSSGSAVWSAMQLAKDLPASARVVVILPDSVRNYMTKFVDDDWMAERQFTDGTVSTDKDTCWWSNLKVSLLDVAAPMTVLPSVSCQDAIDIMNGEGFDQLPVVDQAGEVRGMVTLGSLMANIVSRRVEPSSTVDQVLYSQFHKVPLDKTLGTLSRILQKDHFALIVHDQKLYVGKNSMETKQVIIGIVTQIDLLSFIMAGEEERAKTSGATQ